jgi:hypothetical protein
MPQYACEDHGRKRKNERARQRIHEHICRILFCLIAFAEIRHLQSDLHVASDEKTFQLFLLYLFRRMKSYW